MPVLQRSMLAGLGGRASAPDWANSRIFNFSESAQTDGNILVRSSRTAAQVAFGPAVVPHSSAVSGRADGWHAGGGGSTAVEIEQRAHLDGLSHSLFRICAF